MATSLESCEVAWLRKMLSSLFGLEMGTTMIYSDNESYIKLSQNPIFHDRSKHIEIKYHFIKDRV